MASGFIVLPDSSLWAFRWTAYDKVLETIMNALPDTADAVILKGWLKYILPEPDDLECGYGFIKNERGEEHVFRKLDPRLMKEPFERLFWSTVQELSAKLDKDTDIGYLVNNLNDCYERGLQNGPKDPVLDPYSFDMFFFGGYALGKQPPSDLIDLSSD